MITKSDLRLYLDSPLHLWAKFHNAWHPEYSDFDKKNAADGYRVEKLAMDYLERYYAIDGNKLEYQKTFTDGDFLARTDGLIYKPATDSYDLYEIKSSTYNEAEQKIDKKNLYDITFQYLVLKNNIKIDNCYLVILNANYIRGDDLNLKLLFCPINVDEDIAELSDEVMNMRLDALRISKMDSPKGLEACFSPKKCGCKELCHPDLPEYNIYEMLARSKKKMVELRDAGYRDLLNLPSDVELSGLTALQYEVFNGPSILIDKDKIRGVLNGYEYPIYFFDYETISDPIPQFKGIKPYQNLATQYSLHILSEDGKIEHLECIYEGKECPLRYIIEQMLSDIGPTGTVLAWNKSFEMNVNKNAAESYPDLADKIMAINDRMEDLGDPFSKLYYRNRKFHCSWSIKKVLPVMCPECSYKELPINHGDQASSEWLRMNSDETSAEEKAEIKHNLLKYCELDTWAMVRIWQELNKEVNNG